MGIVTDIDQVTSERYVRIDFGMQLSTPPQATPHTPPFPAPNVRYWRFVLSLFVPFSEWRDQYKIGQKCQLTMKDTGELKLNKSRPS
jgi:hypothetical protein